MICFRQLVSGAVVLSALLSVRAQDIRVLPGLQMIDLDGEAVRLHVLGLDGRRQGSPLVIFEAGLTNSLEAWGTVLPQVAAIAPVVAYDRAGLGRSQWDNVMPTPRHVTKRLRRLLQKIGAEPPYLLVGYSWGGTLIRYFAGYYPHEVAGLVFIDPGPILTQSLADTLEPFEAIGAGRKGYEAYWASFAALFENAAPAVRAEFDVLRRLIELDPADRELRPVPNVPVVVVIAAKYLPLPNIHFPFDPHAHFQADLRHRIRMLQEWALASPRGTLVVSNHTTHAVTREDPDLIIWAVQRALSAATNRP